MRLPDWVRRLTAAPGAIAFWTGALGVLLLLFLPMLAGAMQPPAGPKPAPPRRPAPVTPATGPVTNVLFVGASLTAGMGQTSLDHTYPGLVVAGLRHRGLRVEWAERARWGATAADAMSWPYPSDQQVIVVHLITNDFIRGTPLDTYQWQLRRVLTDLRLRSPQAKLVCLGTWEGPGALNRERVSEEDYDGVARDVCSHLQGEFLPLDQIFADPGSRGPVGQPTPWGPTDNFHPNDVGAQRIADAVLASVSETPRPS